MEIKENPLVTQAAQDRHTDCCTNDTCKACGSRVSTYNCNAALVEQRPTAAAWDWWSACDNADCVHAQGEGVFQEPLDWVNKAKV